MKLFVQQEMTRKRTKRDKPKERYYLMERYREPGDPFERVRKVGTLVDKAAAIAIQAFLDKLEKVERRSSRQGGTESLPGDPNVRLPVVRSMDETPVEPGMITGGTMKSPKRHLNEKQLKRRREALNEGRVEDEAV